MPDPPWGPIIVRFEQKWVFLPLAHFWADGANGTFGWCTCGVSSEYCVRKRESQNNTMSDTPTVKNHAAFIGSVADLLRGDYKKYEYGKAILPLTVLR